MESTDPGTTERERSLATFIDALVAEIEPLLLRHNLACWRASTSADPEAEEESARLEAGLRGVFARREAFAFLRSVQGRGGVADPELARQLLLLANTHQANQLDPATIERIVRLEKRLEGLFHAFRAELDGRRVTENDLRQVLAVSGDGAERRRAWLASKQIGSEIAAGLLELVRLRNAAARAVGFEDHYVMRLALDEQDEAELSRLLDEVERATRPIYERYRRDLDLRLAGRFGIAPEELRPWHFEDPFFQEAPRAGHDLDAFFGRDRPEEILARSFDAIGLDIRALLPRADLYERPGKSQHAFCLCVDRRDDIRVLCNLRPTERAMSTLLHEFGHAAYDLHIDRSLPFVLREPAHMITTEAVAMLFGRWTKNPAWLARHARVPENEARAAAAPCARALRAQLLVQTRWMLVMCRFERALYRDPEQDLDALWWELVEDLQRVRRPEGRHAPDWASKIHFTTAPVYYHHYLIGEMAASQLAARLRRLVPAGGDVEARFVSSPEIGGFLAERLFRRGRTLDWRAALREATGESLSPAAFLEDLTGA